jgi:hypothetical protein
MTEPETLIAFNKVSDSIIISGPDFVGGYVAPEYLVDGVIQKNRLYALTANPYHGKTVIALRLMFCVAHGLPFGGHETEKSRVLFLAGENPDDAKARVIASSDHFGLAVNEDFTFIEGTFNLDETYQAVHTAAGDEGFGLVVIDSNTAFFQGEEENSNKQTLENAQAQRRYSELPGRPTVIALAHPPKNAPRHNLFPRGGSAYFAEIDGNLTLWSDDHKTTTMHWLGKIRGPQFEPFSFEMHGVTSEKVKDAKGRLIPSVVALPVSEERAAQMVVRKRDEQDIVLEIMLSHRGGSIRDWCKLVGWVSDTEKKSPMTSKFSRILETLAGHGLVKQDRDDKYYLTKEGKKEAEKVLEKGSRAI